MIVGVPQFDPEHGVVGAVETGGRGGDGVAGVTVGDGAAEDGLVNAGLPEVGALSAGAEFPSPPPDVAPPVPDELEPPV